MGESKGDALARVAAEARRKKQDQERTAAAKRAALAAGAKLEQIAKAAETKRLDELRDIKNRKW